MRPSLIAVLLVTCAAAAADDLFVFSLTETGDPSNTLTVAGNSVPRLAEDFADMEGSFLPFEGVPFAASVNYAGVPDAIAFSFDPTGGSGGGDLLTITSLLGSDEVIVFDEADGDLGDQLKDFFLEDNPEALSDFIEAINAQSLVGVTDGNPVSMTARSARYKYDWFGLNADLATTKHEVYRDFQMRDYRRAIDRENGRASETGDEAVDVADPPELPNEQRHGWLRSRFHVDGGLVSAGGFDGYTIDAWIGTEMIFSEHVSFHIGGAFGYNNIEGADVFKGGLHLDLPIRIVVPEPGAKVGWTWQVTPGGAIESSGSWEYASGGLMLSGSVVNRVTADLPAGWSITAAQSWTIHQGQEIQFQDIEFDPGVDQQLVKIGGKVSKRIGDEGFLFGGVTWSDFLEEAAVDDFWTPFAGVGFTFRNGATLAIGYEGDFGDDFTRHAGRLDLRFPF